jgi:hypothetical protein
LLLPPPLSVRTLQGIFSHLPFVEIHEIEINKQPRLVAAAAAAKKVFIHIVALQSHAQQRREEKS